MNDSINVCVISYQLRLKSTNESDSILGLVRFLSQIVVIAMSPRESLTLVYYFL